jgi:chaperonin cofactor prefoldin
MQRLNTDSPRVVVPASPDPGQGGGRGDDSGQDSVSQAEYSRAIEAERKRQAGQERAHQREKTRLEKQLDELRQQLRSRQAPPIPNADPLLSRIPENDPVREVLGEVLANQRQYGQFVNDDFNTRAAAEQARALSEAVKGSGVPGDWLDDWLEDNGEELDERTLRLAAREYRRETEIAELRAQVATGQTAVESAETRVREELGANKPFTGQGRPPVGKTVDDQIREVDEFLAEIDDPKARYTREEKMTLTSRAKNMRRTLETWKASGNRAKHPNFD